AFVSFISDNTQKAACPRVVKKPDIKHISEGEGELRHFLNLTSNLLGVNQRDMSFVRVNPAFHRSLGFSDAELKVMTFTDLVHPDEKDHILQILQNVIHAPTGEELRVDFECRMRCKDGGFRWMEWVHKAAADGFVYTVGTDIDDIKQ